ncbi:MAG: ATP-binding protein, partial [Tissierellaceae bacterium]
KPDILMFTRVDLLESNEKTIIRILVEEGTKKPYYLLDKGIKPSGVYVRNGTISSPATEDAIRNMIKNTDGNSFETSRSLLQDLTFNTLSKEFEKRELDFTQIQMENLGIMTSDKIYTNMGLLLSDQCKHSIKVAIFQGMDKSVFKDRKEFSGSLFTQLSEAYRLIEFYNGTKASFHDLMRVDVRDYPEDAIRETLLNAIVHRDYSFSGSTLINIYSDRLEMISLGGLVPGLSLEAAKMGASQARNEKLAALFYRLKLIEAYGTGISKIISSYRDSGLEPIFESAQGAFRVILPNVNIESNSISDSDMAIVDEKYLPVVNLFKEQNEITRKDIERVMGIKSTHAINILKEMLDEGIIKKIGKGKNTRYIKK